MPTDKKGATEDEPERRSVRRSTRASSAQPTASAAAASPVRPRKSIASAAPKKLASSVNKSVSQEDDKERPLWRSRRASSAEPTTAADASPPKTRKSLASSASNNPESTSASARRASIILNRIPEGSDSDRPSTPTKPKPDDASTVGTPRRARRSCSTSVTASPARLTRRTAAALALAALEASAESPETESGDKDSSDNTGPSHQKPTIEDQKSEVNSVSPKVPSQTSKMETPLKQSPSSRIPVHTSKLPTPNKQSPTTRSSSVMDRVDSPSPESPSVRAAIEASRVTTPTSMNQEPRSGTTTPTTGSSQSPAGQSPSPRVLRPRGSTPTQQSPVSAVPSPSGQVSTPTRQMYLRSRSSTPTHSPDTRASVRSHRKCHTPPTQSPEIRSSARSSVRSTGSNRSTPSHSPATRSPRGVTPSKGDYSEAQTAPLGDLESTAPTESAPTTSTKEVELAVADGRVANEALPSPSKENETNQAEPAELKEQNEDPAAAVDTAPEGIASPEKIESEAPETLENGLKSDDAVIEKSMPQTTTKASDAQSEHDASVIIESDTSLSLGEDDDYEELPKKELSTIVEDGSDTGLEQLEGEDEAEVVLAAKVESKPQREEGDANGKKCINAETDPTIPKEGASSEGSQSELSGLDKLCKVLGRSILKSVEVGTSADLGIDLPKTGAVHQLMSDEGGSATPEDHGIVPVKLSPPKRKHSHISPSRLDAKMDDAPKKSPKRKLSEDFSLVLDEADLLCVTPEKGHATAKARRSTPKGSPTLSELTKCVSPLREGRQSPVLPNVSTVDAGLLRNSAVSSLLASEKSPRRREGSPIVECEAPESPEVSPITRGIPSVESSSPKMLNESKKSEKPHPVSPGNQKVPLEEEIPTDLENSSKIRSPESVISPNAKKSSDARSPEINSKKLSETSSPKVNTNPKKSPDSRSPEITITSSEKSSDASSSKVTTTASPDVHCPGNTISPNAKKSSDANSPEIVYSEKSSPKVTTNPEISRDLHSPGNIISPNAKKSISNSEKPAISSKVTTTNPADEALETDHPQETSDASNKESGDLKDPNTRDVQPNPEQDTAKDSPGQPFDESEPNLPIGIIACDEESVDSGNASEDEEKRKIRGIKEHSTGKTQFLDNSPSDVVEDYVKTSQSPLRQTEVQAESKAVVMPPLPSKMEQVRPEPDASELGKSEEEDASEPVNTLERSFVGRKSLGLNATQYSTISLESSGDESEVESDEPDDDESVYSDEGAESCHSDEELLDVSTFAPARRSRRVSFLEQSCVIISDDDQEPSENASGKTVNRFLAVDSSPARACTPGKVKDLVAKINGGSEKSAPDGVVASSSAVGFVAQAAPPTPVGVTPRSVPFASSTASEFVVEDSSITPKAKGPTKKDEFERSTKRKAGEAHLRSPPTKVSRPDSEDAADGPHKVLVRNIPKDTSLAQLKSALRQGGITVGLDSVHFVEIEGEREMRSALASYDSMKNALNAVSLSAKLKLNGHRIFILMEEGQVKSTEVDPPAAKRPMSPQKKFCGIVSNLPPDTTISDITAAFERFAVKNVSQVKIFRLTSHHDSVFAKIRFFKKTSLLKAIVVSENVEIGGRKIHMKIKQQPSK